MEIEKKYLLKHIPKDLDSYRHCEIEQGYLNREPVLRVRKKDDAFILTYKSKGMMIRQEEEFPLTEEAYLHLREKVDGRLISKTRYFIPYKEYTIELDVFHEAMAPLVMAEVEFETKEQADGFVPPSWFSDEVTFENKYQNVNMALGGYDYE